MGESTGSLAPAPTPMPAASEGTTGGTAAAAASALATTPPVPPPVPASAANEVPKGQAVYICWSNLAEKIHNCIAE